jgi:hypothetical protein
MLNKIWNIVSLLISMNVLVARPWQTIERKQVLAAAAGCVLNCPVQNQQHAAQHLWSGRNNLEAVASAKCRKADSVNSWMLSFWQG